MISSPLSKIPYRRRLATAYHEAGHVVMGITLGFDPLSASILPDGVGIIGLTSFPTELPEFAGPSSNPSLKKRDYVEKRVMLKLAGTVAHDDKFPKRRHDDCDRRDYNDA